MDRAAMTNSSEPTAPSATKETTMRVQIFAAAALAAGALLANPAATPARAQGFEYAYCTSGGWSTDNTCRFHTFEQCLTFVQGVGGSCVPNPRAAQSQPSPRGMMRPRR
jgi:hypothetical protein